MPAFLGIGCGRQVPRCITRGICCVEKRLQSLSGRTRVHVRRCLADRPHGLDASAGVGRLSQSDVHCSVGSTALDAQAQTVGPASAGGKPLAPPWRSPDSRPTERLSCERSSARAARQRHLEGGLRKRYRSSCSTAIEITPCNRRTEPRSSSRRRMLTSPRRGTRHCARARSAVRRRVAALTAVRCMSMPAGCLDLSHGPCTERVMLGPVAMRAARTPTAPGRMRRQKWCVSSLDSHERARHDPRKPGARKTFNALTACSACAVQTLAKAATRL